MRKCVLIFLLLSSGCAKGARIISPGAEALPLAQEESEEFYLHRVRYQGETLSLISKWYVGSIDSQVITDATPGLAEHNLQIGDVVLIPVQRLMRREVFKESFIPKIQEKKFSSKKEFPAISKPVEFFITRETDPVRKALLKELHADWSSH